MPTPHKMLDYWGLLDAGVIPSWSRSMFSARRATDPDFPQGILEGGGRSTTPTRSPPTSKSLLGQAREQQGEGSDARAIPTP